MHQQIPLEQSKRSGNPIFLRGKNRGMMASKNQQEIIDEKKQSR
jgi:hypothetical protein